MSFCGCALMFLVTPNQRKTPCICGVFIPVHSNAQLSSHRQALRLTRKVATKEHKRHAKGLIEKLESRIHCGPRIEHGDMMSPDLIKRVKAIGAVVVQNPAHLMFTDGFKLRYQPDQIAWMQPLKSLIAAGIPLAIGSDGPENPFLNVMWATTHATCQA